KYTFFHQLFNKNKKIYYLLNSISFFYAKISKETRENTMYLKLLTNISKRPTIQYTIFRINQLITLAIYAIYPLFIVWLFYTANTQKWNMLLIPFFSFLLLGLFRKIINAPRPYEIHQFTPSLSATSIGQSFPSRHVFSAFV